MHDFCRWDWWHQGLLTLNVLAFSLFLLLCEDSKYSYCNCKNRLVPGFEIANTGHHNNKQLFITILTRPPSCERQYKQTEEKKLERCLYHQVISNVLKKVSVDKTIAIANITFSTMAILLKIQLLKVWVGAAWTRVRFSWELVHQLDRQVGLRPGHRQETEEEPQKPVGEQQTSLWWDLPAVLSLISH